MKKKWFGGHKGLADKSICQKRSYAIQHLRRVISNGPPAAPKAVVKLLPASRAREPCGFKKFPRRAVLNSGPGQKLGTHIKLIAATTLIYKEDKMHGSIKWQVNEIFFKSGINHIDESKHAAKAAARAAGARTWHEIGKKLGVFSYNTADSFRMIWRLFLKHVRDNFGSQDLESTTPEQVESFLAKKIAHGIAHATFMLYTSGLEKLETALNMYALKSGTGRVYNFSSAIERQRRVAHRTLKRFDGSRAYAFPQELIDNIEDPDSQLAARVEYEGGVRLDGVTLMRASQLRGIRRDHLTGELRGHIFVPDCKGGKETMIKVSVPTYHDLEARLEEGDLVLNKGTHRRRLKRAARRSGQKYNASHGLRWNFAQERTAEIQSKGGKSFERALGEVAKDMSHDRSGTTKSYMK